MLELFKNINLGFFVNSTYGLMNGNFTFLNVMLAVVSTIAMGACIIFGKKEK
ncbi:MULTISPECIES: hypothetical protein [unclassified Campylobacter]|uniref:hypothetical protein n=1 Tax=unclassified Campylobacter TaxID=2593542 RepID=UPI00163CDDF1|nr:MULTISPECIES: hypothetical protein [unclassified Campylobacter]